MIPLDKMCGKAERKVEFNSDDYLMLLASTGQPSFYPEVDSDDEKTKKEDKNNNNDKNSSPLQSDGEDAEEKENGETIFDFH